MLPLSNSIISHLTDALIPRRSQQANVFNEQIRSLEIVPVTPEPETIAENTHVRNLLSNFRKEDWVSSSISRESEAAYSDLFNIVRHSLAFFEKNNTQMPDSEIYTFANEKIKKLYPDVWSDSFAVERFSKSRMYHNDVLNYKEAIFNTRTLSTSFFSDLAKPSHEITMQILSSIRVLGGSEEFTKMREVFINILKVPVENRLYESLKVYNLICYSAPACLMMFGVENLNADCISILQAPYEHIAYVLGSMCDQCCAVNLTWSMQFQAYLENSLPDVDFIKRLYATRKVYDLISFKMRGSNRLPLFVVRTLKYSSLYLVDKYTFPQSSRSLTDNVLTRDLAPLITNVDVPLITGVAPSISDADALIATLIIEMYAF